MGRRRHQICDHCGEKFPGDRYNYARQAFCPKPECRRAANAQRQCRHRERVRDDPAASKAFRLKEAERSRLNRVAKKALQSGDTAACVLPAWLHTPEGLEAVLLGYLCQAGECAGPADLGALATGLARRGCRLAGGKAVFSGGRATSYVTPAEHEKPAYVTPAEHENGCFRRT
jgi:hypothetical protein